VRKCIEEDGLPPPLPLKKYQNGAAKNNGESDRRRVCEFLNLYGLKCILVTRENWVQ
jgi:hypothetical protein